MAFEAADSQAHKAGCDVLNPNREYRQEALEGLLVFDDVAGTFVTGRLITRREGRPRNAECVVVALQYRVAIRFRAQS